MIILLNYSIILYYYTRVVIYNKKTRTTPNIQRVIKATVIIKVATDYTTKSTTDGPYIKN